MSLSARLSRREDAEVLRGFDSNVTAIRMFGSIDLEHMISTAVVSISIVDQHDNLVGCACFGDAPPRPLQFGMLSQDTWPVWFNRMFNRSNVNAQNVLWMDFFVARKGREVDVAERVLYMSFLTQPYARSVLCLIPSHFKPVAPIPALFQKIPGDNGDGAGHSVYQCKREFFVPAVRMRRAKIEDHDDLVPIFGSQSEVLTHVYGRFFLAPLIQKQDDSNASLVAVTGGRAVGFLALTTEVDVELIQKCFDLKAYDGLKKPGEMARLECARALVSVLHKLRSKRKRLRHKRRLTQWRRRYDKVYSVLEQMTSMQLQSEAETLSEKGSSSASGGESGGDQSSSATVSDEEKKPSGVSLVVVIDVLRQFSEALRHSALEEGSSRLLEQAVSESTDGWQRISATWNARLNPSQDSLSGANNLLSVTMLSQLLEEYASLVSSYTLMRFTRLMDYRVLSQKKSTSDGGEKSDEQKNDGDGNSSNHGTPKSSGKSINVVWDSNAHNADLYYSWDDPDFADAEHDNSGVEHTFDIPDELDLKANPQLGILTRQLHQAQSQIDQLSVVAKKRSIAYRRSEEGVYSKVEATEGIEGTVFRSFVEVPASELSSDDEVDEDPLPNHLELVAQAADMDSVSLYRGTERKNAFCIILHCLEPSFTVCGEDLLAPSFEVFPGRDYCLLSLPFTAPEPAILQHFVQVPEQPQNTFSHCLYLAHKQALFTPLKVRWAVEGDLPGIISLCGGLEAGMATINRVRAAISEREQALKAAQAHEVHLVQSGEDVSNTTERTAATLLRLGCLVVVPDHSSSESGEGGESKEDDGGDIVGLFVLQAYPYGRELQAEFNLQPLVSEKQLPATFPSEFDVNEHALVLDLVINPIFFQRTPRLCREVCRLSYRSVLLYRFYRDSLVSRPMLRYFFQVRPRRKVLKPRELVTVDTALDPINEKEVDVRREQLADHRKGAKEDLLEQHGSRPFALFAFSYPLSGVTKTVINARVVVVGSSATALATLEFLALSSELHFSHLTLVSPDGFPPGYNPNAEVQILPWKGDASASHLDRIALPANVRVVKSRVRRFNADECTIHFTDGSVMLYDHLVIACDQEEVAVPEWCSKAIDEAQTRGDDYTPLNSRRQSRISHHRSQPSFVTPEDPEEVKRNDFGHPMPAKAFSDEYDNQVDASLATGSCGVRGVFTLNGWRDVARIRRFLKERPGDSQERVCVYGCSLAVFSCIRGLLDAGVAGSTIDLFIPADDESKSDRSRSRGSSSSTVPEDFVWHNGFVHDTVIKHLVRAGVSVFHDASVTGVSVEPAEAGSLYPEEYELSGVYFKKRDSHSESKTGRSGGSGAGESAESDGKSKNDRIAKPYGMLIAHHQLDINPELFQSFAVNSLIYNQGLVVDSRFRTAAERVYAAGPCAKFSLQHETPQPLHSAYHPREVGYRLARKLLRVLDPEHGMWGRSPHCPWTDPSIVDYEDSEDEAEEGGALDVGGSRGGGGGANAGTGEDVPVPPLGRLPEVQYARLPGDSVYFHARSPLYADLSRFGKPLVVTTSAKGRFCQLVFDKRQTVREFVYIGPSYVQTDNLQCLVGLRVSYLNNLMMRHSSGQLGCLIDFFEEQWASALYHESFPLFRQQCNLTLEKAMRASKQVSASSSADGNDTLQGYIKAVKRVLEAQERAQGVRNAEAKGAVSPRHRERNEENDEPGDELLVSNLVRELGVSGSRDIQLNLLQFLHSNRQELAGYDLPKTA